MMVVDASALYKLVVREKNSEQARGIILNETSAGGPIEAPDLIVSEVLNALWASYAEKKSISKSEFDSAVEKLDGIMEDLDIIPATLLKEAAVNVALLKGLPVYDSMYVAAGLLKGAPVLSFDSDLRDAAAELGVRVLGKVQEEAEK